MGGSPQQGSINCKLKDWMQLFRIGVSSINGKVIRIQKKHRHQRRAAVKPKLKRRQQLVGPPRSTLGMSSSEVWITYKRSWSRQLVDNLAEKKKTRDVRANWVRKYSSYPSECVSSIWLNIMAMILFHRYLKEMKNLGFPFPSSIGSKRQNPCSDQYPSQLEDSNSFLGLWCNQ